MKKTISYTYAALLAVAVLGGIAGAAAAASQPAVSVMADAMQYDGKTQIATATGNVVIVRDQATMTGDKAVYNLKTAEADMDGNVTVQQPDMHLTAAKLHSTNKNYVIATGDVRGIYGDKKLNGDQVEYYLDQDYGIVTGNGYLEADGSQMWADHIDAWTRKSLLSVRATCILSRLRIISRHIRTRPNTRRHPAMTTASSTSSATYRPIRTVTA